MEEFSLAQALTHKSHPLRRLESIFYKMILLIKLYTSVLTALSSLNDPLVVNYSVANINIFPQTCKDLRENVLLLSLGDDGLGDPNGIFYTVHIETGIHVVVEEVAGFIIGEIAEVIIEPL